jgi:hypothetical protein
MQIYRYILIGAVMLGACTQGKEDAKLWSEAAAIHNEAIQTAANLEDSLQVLAMDSTLQDSVKLYIEAIENWKADVVEVPGNEADHHDELHHHHAPPGSITITAAEMIAVQRTLKIRIDSIAARVLQVHDN